MKGRFGKRELIWTKEPVTATCSDGLFFLIDAKPEEFRIRSLAESRQFLPGDTTDRFREEIEKG